MSHHEAMTATAASSEKQYWPADMRHATGMNVGETERVVSVMGGAVLALLGLAHGGLAGSAMALGGGALVYRGLTGRCEAYRALGIDTAHGCGESFAAF